MKPLIFILLTGLVCPALLWSQKNDSYRVDWQELYQLYRGKKRILPDVPGYQTLKGDFHLHTVFSDGRLDPAYRPVEAWREGLDVIAITDHFHPKPTKSFVTGDANSPYEIARPVAEMFNILLIKATEMSCRPGGHMQALFMQDNMKLDRLDGPACVEEANRQGALVTINHPGYKQASYSLSDLHLKYIREKKIQGIEVFNTHEFYPLTIDWAQKYGLTMYGNTDAHEPTADLYDLNGSHRPMTLLFARERSLPAVKEALKAGRTLVYFGNVLVGNEENAAPFVKQCIRCRQLSGTLVEIENCSEIKFTLQSGDDHLELGGLSTTVVDRKRMEGLKNVLVKNVFVGQDRNLELNLW